MYNNDHNFSLYRCLDILKRQFLCTFPVKSLVWQEVFNKWEAQEDLINCTIYHERNIDYPVRLSYQKAFLKFVIQHLEARGETVNDIVYNSLGEIVGQVDDENKLCYRHYLTFKSDISLCENVQIISEGTTGLTTWPAALVLAEWCLANKEQLQSKTVVELGAGLGLVGLTTLLNCRPSHLVLTDCHHKVLSKLCDNVRLNLHLFRNKNANSSYSVKEKALKLPTDNCLLHERLHFDEDASCSSVISVLEHSWGEGDQKVAELIQPDILLAADVVYDSLLFPLLVKCIKAFQQAGSGQVHQKKELILVCTERNTDTLAEFLKLLCEECIVIEGTIPEQNFFIWSTETPIRLFTVITK